MEHLLQKSKCSIFDIFKYMIFQRRKKALLWSKGLKEQLNAFTRSKFDGILVCSGWSVEILRTSQRFWGIWEQGHLCG